MTSAKTSRQIGQEVGRLVLALKLPDEAKTAWAAQLPKMNVAQLKKALDILGQHAVADVYTEMAKIRKECNEILLRESISTAEDTSS